MAAPLRFRDVFTRISPWWLSDRQSSGKTVGYRFLFCILAVLDALAEVVLQGMRAAWPGAGTPTALALIGRSRGILRGQSDTDAEYIPKLISYLDKWEQAGAQRQLAIELHEFLGNHPRVRIVNRAGHWITVNADGTITTHEGDWDWDSVSHPERVNFWSDLWVIIYPTQWAVRPLTLGDLTGDDGFGLGHLVRHEDADLVKSILSTWKGAHSRVRAVIWTSDATLFDPTNPSSLPDGEWGAWGGVGSGSRVASHRNYTTCRYWEPWR